MQITQPNVKCNILMGELPIHQLHFLFKAVPKQRAHVCVCERER